MTGPEPRRCVVLIGFMGAGKTTVGRLLAQRLGWKFFDLDALIEQQEQRSIAAIFEEPGEKAFRAVESAALTQLLERSEGGCVIALGGGAFVQQQNREALERAGATTVLLSAPLEELQRRCKKDGATRPLARDKARFEELFAARQQAYSLCRFQVETLGREVQDIAAEVEHLVLSS